MAEIKDYELAGIEVIARGIAIREGKVLLCRAKGGSSTYLPGGHIEFGEKGAQALVREIKEEMGLDSTAGDMIGVVENAFMQKGKPHQEINLVYTLSFEPMIAAMMPTHAMEDWIEFEWCPLAELEKVNLLPADMIPLVRGTARL